MNELNIKFSDNLYLWVLWVGKILPHNNITFFHISKFNIYWISEIFNFESKKFNTNCYQYDFCAHYNLKFKQRKKYTSWDTKLIIGLFTTADCRLGCFFFDKNARELISILRNFLTVFDNNKKIIIKSFEGFSHSVCDSFCHMQI